MWFWFDILKRGVTSKPFSPSTVFVPSRAARIPTTPVPAPSSMTRFPLSSTRRSSKNRHSCSACVRTNKHSAPAATGRHEPMRLLPRPTPERPRRGWRRTPAVSSAPGRTTCKRCPEKRSRRTDGRQLETGRLGPRRSSWPAIGSVGVFFQIKSDRSYCTSRTSLDVGKVRSTFSTFWFPRLLQHYCLTELVQHVLSIKQL